jgi:homoserine O-acetyltransferase
MKLLSFHVVVAGLSLAALSATAQDMPTDYSALREMAVTLKYPQPFQKDFVIKNFQFQSGETLPELKVHYTTVGSRGLPAVLILHGGGGSGTNYLSQEFADQLFGPGQPLDARRYFIILPDAIGAGRSSKPSDGLGVRFPRYNHADNVAVQYRLVTEALGLKHLRLVLGNSMGGRQTWMWGAQYPDFMDALVPMATSPGAWTQNANAAPAAPEAPGPADANDVQFRQTSTRNVPAPVLQNIKAYVLAINSQDDASNPPERAGLAEAVALTPHGQFYVIPKSPSTIGHQTTSVARFWAKQVGQFLATVPKSDVTR